MVAPHELVSALLGAARSAIPALTVCLPPSAAPVRGLRASELERLGLDGPVEATTVAEAVEVFVGAALVALGESLLGCENSAALTARPEWNLEDPTVARALSPVRQLVSGLPPGAVSPWLPGELVQAVVPAGLRKRLGEFYTPRWLAERVLDLSGWAPHDGEIPGLVDPTCGAGAFLVPAWLRAVHHLESVGAEGAAIVAKASAIRGHDVSPLAVLASRVAWLACVHRHLGGRTPVFPVTTRDLVGACFAPRTEQVSFVVGNPPWVRWSELQEQDKDAVSRAVRHYDLLPGRTWHGGSELDLSALMTFSACDVDLRAGGAACLVLSRAHLHACASSRFRSGRVGDARLTLEHIEDLERVRVFRDAAVHAIVIRFRKGEALEAPAGARTRETSPIPPGAGWDLASRNLVSEPMSVVVAQPDHRWCLCAPSDAPVFERLSGGSDWVRGRKGITSDLNGAYFVRVLGAPRPGVLQVVNDRAARSAVPSHTFEIEESLVFPLLKGAGDLAPFVARHPEGCVIVPNHGIQKLLPPEAFRERFPLAWSHFCWVEEQTGGALSRRATFRRTARPGQAFFTLYNVGAYTFLPFKVAWPEISNRFRAAVVGPSKVTGTLLPVVPDHKVYFAAFDSEAPADFVCALLNAGPVRRFVEGMTARLQIGALLHTLRLPGFEPERALHAALAAGAHEMRLRPDAGRASELDRLSCEVLGVRGESQRPCQPPG